MSRQAACLTGPLLLLLATGSVAWADPAAPTSAASPTPAAAAPASTNAASATLAAAAPAPTNAASATLAAAASVPADPAAKAADAAAAPAEPTPAPAAPAVPAAATGVPAVPAASPAAAPKTGVLRLAEAAGDQQAPAAPAAAAPAAAPPAPKLDISGFVDMYYEYNFNRPPKFVRNSAGQTVPVPGGVENVLRNFDFKHNELALNLAELQFKHSFGPIGLQVNLAYGKATDYIHAAEPGGLDTYRHILQAFFTVPLKFWSKDDTIDAGIFVTPAGNEVIETKDNWNYTRGLLFAWAIPYYHAGVRYHHVINSTSGLGLMLVNGWNDVEDNNNTPSVGVSYNTTFGKKLPWVINYIGGPELTNDNHNWRNLVDTTLTFNQSDKMAFAVNADYAHEDRDGGSVHWWGIAGYARRQLTPRTAFVLRGEYFADSNGASTGVAQHVKEITATYELKGPAGLITRAEFRYDWSNRGIFLNSDGGVKDTQPTFLVGAVYAF